MYRPTFTTKSNGVPVLSKEDIEAIGENFMLDFCPDALKNPQQFDVERFMEVYLGLNVDYQYLSNDGRYLGMMVFNDTDKVIVFDPENNRAEYIHADARTVLIDNTLLAQNQEHRYRYTAVHECGHDIFHWGYYSYNPDQLSFFDRTEEEPMVQCRDMRIRGKSALWGDTEWMEWQSNFFSSVMLMPKKAVLKLHKGKKGGTISNTLVAMSLVSRTSQVFNVSPEAAKYRLEHLGILRPGCLSSDISFLGNGSIIFSE